MKKLQITITEKKKLITSFNLLNFREEIVNFMYKKTVADSSRSSMMFYVLIFFLSLKINSKSLLLDILDSNINKLVELNKIFAQKKKLKQGEYAEIVKSVGLQDIFRFDVFFLLTSSIINSDNLLIEFSEYFESNPEIKSEFLVVLDKYKNKLSSFNEEFGGYVIVDDRIDDNGEYHDLSKSVDRTIRMRTSRRLDVSLHKYAELKNVTSQSPVVVSILQHVNPEIIVQIWETYKLDEYVKAIWDFVSPFASGLVVLYLDKSGLADKWINWKTINGRTSRKKKNIARNEYNLAKADRQVSKQQEGLAESLIRSIVKSNEFLMAEVVRYKKDLERLKKDNEVVSSRKKNMEIKMLKEKIEKLENIEIKVEEA